ncbi:hypothetical protein EYF80_009564 [Liparis tanakae]|uniref:Uncharacterized protein n=1 Tax=Liparis tanakae TaxID=230148 RepID=A0A4Z2IQJ9_9TELE|nr:hypothetical protein EYF80_009564 [Liparis tanakae]
MGDSEWTRCPEPTVAARTGVREDRKTSKLRMSPSISSRGSTSFVVGMFLEILQREKEKDMKSAGVCGDALLSPANII